MHLRRGPISMIRKESYQIEPLSRSHAGRNEFRRGVKNGRREMSTASIAGKKIRAEQQPQRLTIEPHMPSRMAGHMHRAQTVPDIENITILKPSIRLEWPKRKQWATDHFQNTGHSRPAIIARRPAKCVSSSLGAAIHAPDSSATGATFRM